MTSVVKITEVVQALADRIAAGADTTSAGTSPNHLLKAAMVAKGYFQAGQGAGGIPTPYQDKKFLSNNGTELEWRTTLPDIDDPTEPDGDVVIIREGDIVTGNLIPKPYIADQVLSNNGTQLEWHDLPDNQLPPIITPISPDEYDKILVIENGVVKWLTLTGGITLPDTTGQDGKLLTTNGAPLSEGGGLFWGVPAGAPGSGTPGSLIGYAHAYTTDEYTFSAMVYPDFNGAIAAESDVMLAPVIRWGNTSVVTLDDGETPAGTWVEDGVFEFGRSCFATLYISLGAVAEFNDSTGTAALPELCVVHETKDDFDIVGVIIGRNFTPPYGVNRPTPTIGGSTNCSVMASAGDRVSLRGLVTVFGGTGGEIRYGAIQANARSRPNFGMLIMEAFPGYSMPVPVATPVPTPTPVPTTTPVATPVPTTTPGLTPTPDPTPVTRFTAIIATQVELGKYKPLDSTLPIFYRVWGDLNPVYISNSEGKSTEGNTSKDIALHMLVPDYQHNVTYAMQIEVYDESGTTVVTRSAMYNVSATENRLPRLNGYYFSLNADMLSTTMTYKARLKITSLRDSIVAYSQFYTFSYIHWADVVPAT